MKDAPKLEHFSTLAEFTRAVFDYRRLRYAQQAPDRSSFRQAHPVHTVFLQCIDGRHDLEAALALPLGVSTEFPVAGKFEVASQWGGHLLREEVDFGVKKRGNALIISSFHFSRSSNHSLGCKAFNHDLDVQVLSMLQVREALQDQYHGSGVVGVIVVGMETDTGDLWFVGQDPTLGFYTSECSNCTAEEIREKMRVLYPGFSQILLEELTYYVQQNLKFQEQRKVEDVQNLDHAESILFYGRIRPPFPYNSSFAVSPFESQLDQEVALQVAGNLIHKNLVEKRADPAKGALLLVCAVCEDAANGPEVEHAKEKARGLADRAIRALRNAPESFAGAAKLEKDFPFEVMVGYVNRSDLSYNSTNWDFEWQRPVPPYALPSIKRASASKW